MTHDIKTIHEKPRARYWSNRWMPRGLWCVRGSGIKCYGETLEGAYQTWKRHYVAIMTKRPRRRE